MKDAQSKLMAMQNGEIDVYDGLSASDIEIYSADPGQYQLYSVPTQSRTYMFMNPDRIPESVREAITYVVDRDAIVQFMGGILSPAYGVYRADKAYGKVQQPNTDLNKAKAIMEADGYTLNDQNIYAKDGTALPTIGLYCYAARNIDSIALLIKEQLAKFGISSEIKLVEDPDGTYMSNKDYDICFYFSGPDKTGDPMPFMDGVVKSGSYQDIAGYGNAEADR